MLLREVADGFAVSKFVGMAHRVRQHYALEALPRRFGFEDGEERPETCSGREQPQMLCIRHFGKGEKPGGLRCNPNRVTRFKRGQALGEQSTRHLDEIEFQRCCAGCIDEGKGAADHFPVNVERKLGELSGLERRHFGGHLQLVLPLGLASLAYHRTFYKFAHSLLHFTLTSGQLPQALSDPAMRWPPCRHLA